MSNDAASALVDATRKCAQFGAILAIELKRDTEFWRPGGETWDVDDPVMIAVQAAHYGRMLLAAGGGR